jgi:hypothetical protein
MYEFYEKFIRAKLEQPNSVESYAIKTSQEVENQSLQQAIVGGKLHREIREVMKEETKDMKYWTINAVYATVIQRIEKKYLLVRR